MRADADVCRLIDDVLAGERPAVDFDADLWATVTELGLHRLTGDEKLGGSAMSWAEGSVLASRSAYHASAVPVVDHDLLAGWLADRLGQPTGDLTAVAILDVNRRASAVAWAPKADSFVLVWPATGAEWSAALVPAADVRMRPVAQLAARPTGDVEVPALPSGTAVSARVVEELRQRGSLARSLQICGAMDRAVESCVEHLTTRVQFGRPLAKFQALQHQLVDVTAEASLARTAAEAALATVAATGFTGERSRFAVAAARSVTGHAVSTVVRGAHQLHGAIGTTREHELHRYTNAMLAWRGEWGSTLAADHLVGEQMMAAGSADSWQRLIGQGE